MIRRLSKELISATYYTQLKREEVVTVFILDLSEHTIQDILIDHCLGIELFDALQQITLGDCGVTAEYQGFDMLMKILQESIEI